MIRRVCILALMVLGISACDTGTVPSSIGAAASVPPPSPTAAATRQPTGALPDASTDAPVPAISEPPSDDVPARPDPATFLQVCWREALAGVAPVPCSDVVEAALSVPELAGARIDRVELGGQCDPPRSCGRAVVRPTVWVTVLSDHDPLIVDLVLDAGGGLMVQEVHPALASDRPTFTPPAPGLAELAGVPPGLAAREAYPLCGTESASMGGPYDETARTCFLNGVLAGSPVEFATIGAGTEGGAVVDLYRYAGSGGIEHVTGEGGTWVRSFTGIADAGGGLVFAIGGMATAPEPVP